MGLFGMVEATLRPPTQTFPTGVTVLRENLTQKGRKTAVLYSARLCRGIQIVSKHEN
jgi:hypothetical protein